MILAFSVTTLVKVSPIGRLFFLFFWSATPCASPPPWPPFYPIILLGATTLLTGMTGNSLNMQLHLTSQLHGSVSQREQLFFVERSSTIDCYRQPRPPQIWKRLSAACARALPLALTLFLSNSIFLSCSPPQPCQQFTFLQLQFTFLILKVLIY
jgi:hypothetical protein